MFLRKASIVGVVVVTTACMGPMRLERQLPEDSGGLTDIRSVVIIDEGGTEILHGDFSAPYEVEGTLTRVAPLVGAADSGMGSATLENEAGPEGTMEETMTIVIDGLAYPALYTVRVDGRQVTAFSTTAEEVDAFLAALGGK